MICIKYFLNLIERYKIQGAEEKINQSIEMAVFNILVIGLMREKKPKDLINKYGKNKTYWSRVPSTEVGQNTLKWHKFLKNINVPKKGKFELKEDMMNEFSTKDLYNTLVTIVDKEVAGDRLWEGKQDWSIAIKMARAGDTEKAVKFLKGQGHSKKTIDKMLKESKKQ